MADRGDGKGAATPRGMPGDGTPDRAASTPEGRGDDEAKGSGPPGDRPAEEEPEGRYKRNVAITLAALAILGAWIAVLQTNASTNEARTAREATRLASEAQTAAVLEAGALGALERIEAEQQVFPLRSTFVLDEEAASEAGAAFDPDRAAQRLAEAQAAVDATLGDDGSGLFDLQVEARRLALQQAATVEERVTWNARASQYETVITTLAVAIFLVGFTLVVRRQLRPPLAVPGLLLALYCLGWSIHIYRKPIPDVKPAAIEATAVGEAELDRGRASDAAASFTSAIEADDDYEPAFRGRGLARFVVANPDVLTTLAFTDTSTAALEPVAADLARAIELGGDASALTETIAGYVAIAAERYDLASELLERAVEINPLTPGAQFALSAVSVARGDPAAALEWRTRAAGQLGPLEQTDRNRALVAQYLTLLEWVVDRAPEATAATEQLRDDSVAVLSELVAQRPLRPEDAGPASVAVDGVSYEDGTTTVALSTTGDVPEDAIVAVVGYERPAEGAPWVQPPELFYTGPVVDQAEPTPFATPRTCVAVEYRVDLYVEGVLADSATAPGGTPTC